MTLQKITHLIKELSTLLSLEHRHILHTEIDRAYEKMTQLFEQLKNAPKEVIKNLSSMPMDCLFFARIILAKDYDPKVRASRWRDDSRRP